MANRQTQVDSKRGDDHLAITQHETDSPLIPVAAIERLKAVAPERVDWVFEQTEIEATARRSRIARVDWMIFAERMTGQVAALVACISALYVAHELVKSGHEVAGAAIGTTAVVGLATAFLANNRRK